MRVATAQALGDIGDARAVEPLIVALGDQDEDVPWAAARALGEIGDARAVEPLIAALGDKRVNVRKAASSALGDIGDGRAVEPLIDALGDKNVNVRSSAAAALEKLGWKPDCEEAGARYWIIKEEWDKCASIGAPAVDVLVTLLKDTNKKVRRTAVEALEKLGWKPEARVPTSFYAFVFNDNELNTFARSEHNIEMPAGDSVVVNCFIDLVPGTNYVGIVKIDVLKVTFPDPTSLPNKRPTAYEMREIEDASFEQSSVDAITKQQRIRIISVIKKSPEPWLWDGAVAKVKRSLQGELSKKDEAQELYREGSVRYGEGDLSEASRLIESGLELYPAMSSARMTLGEIAIESGQSDKAIRCFEQELELSERPLEQSAHMYLSAIYDAMGNHIAAARHAQSAMSTESYKKAPTVLTSEWVAKIHAAVANTNVSDEAKAKGLGLDLDSLANELITIGSADGFFGKGAGFNSRGRNLRVVEIGEILHKRGQLELMRKVYYMVSSDSQGNPRPYPSGGTLRGNLESAWDGIGWWEA